MRFTGILIGVNTVISLTAAAEPPDYDFQFSTIGAVGNAAVQSYDPNYQFVNGRGQVNYQYRMSKLEVTTGQWLEFLNTFPTASNPHQFWDKSGPVFWGATQGANGLYTLRNDVPNAAMLPVGGITWRMAALYCNWLHSGKAASPDSLITGAYDSTTWGFVGNTTVFTDDATHLPGAQYWIPTLDEQLKAFQYDPNRYGTNQGGWWESRNMSDTAGTPGPPGQGTTSAGYRPDGEPFVAWNITLGAYPQSVSPWGLLDTSGGGAEWNEERYPPQPNDFGAGPTARGMYGAWAGDFDFEYHDLMWFVQSRGLKNSDTFDIYTSLRIASAVPSPTSLLPLVICTCMTASRRRLNRETT